MVCILRANAPLRLNARIKRVEATRNWLSLPMVGTKGVPEEACQSSSSDESMDVVWIGGLCVFGKPIGRQERKTA